jgi:hypothetical protein
MVGGQVEQTVKQNDAGVQGAIPRSAGTRTIQNGPGEVSLLGFAGLPAWDGKNKRNSGK